MTDEIINNGGSPQIPLEKRLRIVGADDAPKVLTDEELENANHNIRSGHPFGVMSGKGKILTCPSPIATLLMQLLDTTFHYKSRAEQAEAQVAVLVEAANAVRSARISCQESIYDELEALVHVVKNLPAAATALMEEVRGLRAETERLMKLWTAVGNFLISARRAPELYSVIMPLEKAFNATIEPIARSEVEKQNKCVNCGADIEPGELRCWPCKTDNGASEGEK